MIDINEYVTKNFNDNIEYIENQHPKLFSLLSSLDNAIANAQYQEKYELVYENDSFDVLEKSTKIALYDGQSKRHAEASANSLDYKIEHDTFETFNEKNVSDEDANKYSSIEPFTHRLYGMGKIINFTQKKSLQKESLKSIDKYIFYGVGLGLHIEAIHKIINSKVYLIIEDDLELFRLSLFTINYKNLSKNSKIIFSVFEGDEEFSNTATEFLQEQYYYNHYIKMFRLLSHSDAKINQFRDAILQQAHFGFHHSNLLLHYMKGLNYLQEGNFLNRSIKFTDDIFMQKPFLLLAAGPSLQNHQDWLKENQNSFTIVAIAATLPFLAKHDIKPDIVVQLDAYESSAQHFSDEVFDFIKDSIYIFSAKVPESIVSRLNKNQLFFFENGTNYKENSLKPSSPCAGSTTYQLALLFGVKDIYLLGLDLALDNATGKTHVDTHVNARSVNTQKDNYEHKTYKVAGNTQESVSTILLFKSSISAIDYSTKMLKQKNQTVYNLGDGAKFFDTVSLSTEEIKAKNKSDKKELHKHTLLVCKNNSTKGLNQSEQENIQDKLIHARKTKEYIQDYTNASYKNPSAFIEALIILVNATVSDELLMKYELTKVLDTYYRRILSYIFDYFNTNEKYSKEDISLMNELFFSHILEIIDYYDNSIKSKLNR